MLMLQQFCPPNDKLAHPPTKWFPNYTLTLFGGCRNVWGGSMRVARCRNKSGIQTHPARAIQSLAYRAHGMLMYVGL